MTIINNIYFQNPQLDGASILYKGSNTGILLIHGFTATTIEVKKLADYFIKKGFSVSAPLLPGHGTSPKDLNKVKYRDWVECVDNAYQELKLRCNQIFIGGESMGAVLSLYLAERYTNIKALFLFSTALMVKKLKYAKYIKYFVPFKDKGLPNDGLPWQGYTVYPMYAAAELFKLTKLVDKSLYNVFSPTLLFQGKFDRSIDVNNIEYIYSKISSDVKVKVTLENSGHAILMDKEFDVIYTNINEFLDHNQIL